MANKKDFYETLGISKSASKDEIKSAYRKLAKKYHPDLNQEPGAEQKFKDVQEAYDILYDDSKRASYDQFGHAAFEQGGPGNGNPFGGGFSSSGFQDVDLNDIFSSFFGGGSSRQRKNYGPQKGDDTLTRMRISFMDAVLGRKVTIPVTYDEPCEKCGGTGAKSSSDIVNCGQCNGTGYVKTQQRTLFGVMEGQAVCPTCHGTGKIIKNKCDACGGKGYQRVKKDITVNVPAGINSGQQIRVAGKGSRGANGGPNGDLYLEIVIIEHKIFKRNGNDIHIEVPLGFVEAALGTKIDVPTVYGTVELKVPAGTQPQQILKLKNKGIKDMRRGTPGDQYVHLNIKTPTSLSKEQKTILENYKDTQKNGDPDYQQFAKNFE